MKELASLSGNFHHVKVAEKLEPQIEVVLVLSEVLYRLHGGEVISPERTASTIRFSTSVKSCRALAAQLIKLAEGAEAEARALPASSASSAVK